MKDRIKLIMENENLTSARFADKLNINRAVISHILNGRNNPSLDVVTKILSEMDYINPEWLIIGEGEIYKNGTGPKPVTKEPDLFSQEPILSNRDKAEIEIVKETDSKGGKVETHQADNEPYKHDKIINKKISQIIIYFNDNTFQRMNPE